MATGPSLVVRLGVTGLTGVQAAFSRVQGMAGSLASGVSRLAMSATGLLAGAAGIAGVTVGLKEALDMGGRLSDVSAKTGIATRSLTVLEQAFKDSGVAAEAVGKSVAKMQDTLVSAARGDAGPARAFKTLGLDVQQLLSLEPDRQLAEIGKAIAGLDDPARRTAAAMDVFGRSGTELMTLFRDATVFDGAAQRVGGLAEVMGRRAAAFDAISDAIGGLKVKTMGLFAGMADAAVPELSRLANAINAMDLTPIGQKVGGFAALAIEDWQAGRFGELIGLTIEAGFEAGGIAARATWTRLMEWLGSGSFWGQFAIAVVSISNSTMKALANGLLAVVEPAATFNRWFASQFEATFTNIWQAFKDKAVGAINWVMQRISPGWRDLNVSATKAVGMTWDEAAAKSAQVRSETSGEVGALFDGGTASARSVFGGSATANASALEELNRRINVLVAERTRVEAGALSTNRAALELGTSKVRVAEMEREARERLMLIENRRAKIEGDFAITAADKWRLKRASLQEERKELEAIVAALRAKAALEVDPAAKEQMLTRADSYEGRISSKDRNLRGMGADPYSTPEQITSAITGLEDQFGTTAQAIGRSFTSVIGTAVDSVAQGIEGLIMGTMTWADALRNVAQTMLTSIVQAISRMFAEWIAKRALSAAKNMLFSAQEGATDVAAKTPGALMSSISSYGVAAAVGVAALLAAMAAFGGFRSGGYTGDMPPGQVAGVVHGKEFVFDAPAVQRIGLDNLEAMRSGAVPASGGDASGEKPQVNSSVQIASFDSRLDAKRWANSQEGEVWFVDMARRTSHRWSRA